MATKSRRRSRPLALLGVLSVAAVVGGLTVHDGGGPTTGDRHALDPAASRQPAPTANRLAGRRLYVDPAGAAAVQARQWEAQGRGADARQLRKIADRPVADWVSVGPAEVAQRVGALVGRAQAARQVPVLVAYNIPHRDCDGFSAGGAASAQEYREWVRAFARGIGHRPGGVILEPDARAHTVDGCKGEGPQRYALLRDAIAVLKATGSAVVYLDAGNPGWITDTDRLAAALRRAGIAQADGFALNVANFATTKDNVAFGERVSDALGGNVRFVVDTSRNGNGGLPDHDVDAGPRWCNPPGRALGIAPTTDPGRSRVDAFLWIKRPGESDGACRPGEPAAGQWWPQYALALAKRSP